MKRFLLAGMCLVFGWMCLQTQVVLACTPPALYFEEDKPPIEWETLIQEQIDVIFVGTVVESSFSDADLSTVLTFEVSEYLKGTGPDRVTVGRFGESSVCLTNYADGTSGIVYTVNSNEGACGWFSQQEADLCAYYYSDQYYANTSPLIDDNAENRALVQTATGQEPTAPDGTLGAGSQGGSTNQSGGNTVLIGAALIGLLLLLVIGWQRLRNK